MPTRSGVYYDLTESPYFYHVNGYTFFFSSFNHLKRFRGELGGRVEYMNASFRKRFKFSINAWLFAALQFYARVETRGFYVVNSYRAFTNIADFDVQVVENV